MASDLETLDGVVTAALPFVVRAAKEFGHRLLDRGESAAVDEASGLGGRLVSLVFRRGRPEPAAAAVELEALRTALTDVIDNPDDSRFRVVLEVALLKVLRSDATLADQTRRLLQADHRPAVTGDRAVVGTITDSTVITGDGNRVVR